jgi:hypothetical protein
MAGVPEVNNQPIKEGRWSNLNTREHQENNRRLQRAILLHIAKYPISSAVHIWGRMQQFLLHAPADFGNRPLQDRMKMLSSPELRVLYGRVVILCCCFLVVCAVACILASFEHPRNIAGLLLDLENNLLLVVAACILVFSIGEAGEDARFVISLLPMIAVFPIASPLKRSGSTYPVASIVLMILGAIFLACSLPSMRRLPLLMSLTFVLVGAVIKKRTEQSVAPPAAESAPQTKV